MADQQQVLNSRKKHFLEYGKIITNGIKLSGALVVLLVNIYWILFHNKFLTWEEQKSFLLAVGFCEAPFLGIDISLIFQNIFNRN
jgi:hypothetical protein